MTGERQIVGTWQTGADKVDLDLLYMAVQHQLEDFRTILDDPEFGNDPEDAKDRAKIEDCVRRLEGWLDTITMMQRQLFPEGATH